VGFDRIKTFGQRQGSRETRLLDAEAGRGGNPARVLELVDCYTATRRSVSSICCIRSAMVMISVHWRNTALYTLILSFTLVIVLTVDRLNLQRHLVSRSTLRIFSKLTLARNWHCGRLGG
jgi:hypothetical protein